ncbi:MAG: DUF423 domain-containing protein [Bacteroidetes bacterium]|jgi:uncharacterized membrane protein YgdD (TMEM256/DUF423 family)|nr:DUF423 domain-containing protein [Bacteroidota bacterium]
MRKQLLVYSSISGLCAVALGAMGAHQLKGMLAPEMMEAFRTGVLYQFLHTLVVMFIAVINVDDKWLKRSALSFIAGTVLFSGSIYGLALSSLSGSIWKWLGPITPLGGLCFMAGWVFLLFYALKNKS